MCVGRAQAPSGPGRVCREPVVAAGSDDLDWFEGWRYDVAARNGRHRRHFRKIDPDDVARCADVARELGLPSATLATLATMAILLHVPGVPDDKKLDLLDELTRFGSAIERRAVRAQEFGDQARTTTPPSLNLSFDDVLDRVKQKKKKK